MSSWHSDDECKEVIDERVECLVHERPPGQVSHRLQLVVDKQLRQHEQKTESVNTVDLQEQKQVWLRSGSRTLHGELVLMEKLIAKNVE